MNLEKKKKYFFIFLQRFLQSFLFSRELINNLRYCTRAIIGCARNGKTLDVFSHSKMIYLSAFCDELNFLKSFKEKLQMYFLKQSTFVEFVLPMCFRDSLLSRPAFSFSVFFRRLKQIWRFDDSFKSKHKFETHSLI
jgi:hypothetical protein